jgi:hypothetical protein
VTATLSSKLIDILKLQLGLFQGKKQETSGDDKMMPPAIGDAQGREKFSEDLVSGVRVGEKGLCWDYSMDGNFGRE